MLLNRPASILIKTCVLNNKRTMSTSSEPVAVRVYLNPDKDKELIVDENKARAGIYRWVQIESGKSYIGSSKLFYVTRSYSTLNKKDSNSQSNAIITPAALYPDAFLNKNILLKDNKNKAGVYRWVNKVNDSSYIGSSVNLNQRLRSYFNFSFITRSLVRNKSLIYSAILKYGYSNFQLEILEYCLPENAISREQYYLDLLKPNYNINSIAGSRLGSIHSEESRLKMSNSAKGRKHTEETKILFSLAKKGINNPNFGKTRSEKTKALYTLARLGKSFLSEAMKAKMSERSGTSLSVLDLKTNETSVYPSIKKAAQAMGVSQPAITKRLSKSLDTFVVKKQYQVKKVNILSETNDKSIDIVRSQTYKPVNSGVSNGKRSMSTSSRFVPVIPVKIYSNSDQDKELIVDDNKGRAGIYRWVHIESGKSYIGSSTKLNIRFRQYFNYNHISYPKRNMAIYKSLLKYGYAKFRLEILEYCSIDKLLQREQFYFDKYSPEYNLLKLAGSPLGYRHSEASKTLIGIASKNRKVSESTRDFKRKALLGKTLDKKHLEKMRLSNTLRQPVLLTNLETGDIQEFSSMTDAGVFLGVSRVTVRKFLLTNIPYKGYKFSKAPSKDNCVAEPLSKSNFIKQQALILTNKLTGISKEFSSIKEAAEYLEISRARLWYFFKNTANAESDTLKGYIVSKITDTEVKVSRKSIKIEVTNIDTNEITTYPSLTLAAEALNIPRNSLSVYFSRKRTNLYKKKYYFKLI